MITFLKRRVEIIVETLKRYNFFIGKILPSNGVSDINQIWFNKKKVCLSSEDFVIGLATFNGRNVRNDNGFHNVTVLMTSNDLTMCIKYQSYVNHDGLRQKVISKKCAPRWRTLSHHGLRPVWSKKICPSSEDFITSRTLTN